MDKMFTVRNHQFMVYGYGWAHNRDHERQGLNMIANRVKALNPTEVHQLHLGLLKWDEKGGPRPGDAVRFESETIAELTTDYKPGVEAGTFYLGALL